MILVGTDKKFVEKDFSIYEGACEYQESTLQLPFGEFSILSELKAGCVTAVEAMVALTLCYRSYWASGLTWRTSVRKLAKLLDLSNRYIRSTLEKLGTWIQRWTAPKGNVAGTFKVTHHQCEPAMVPTDKDGHPKSFAVPRGEGGLFERLFAGHIDWKAALIWLLLKLHSDWTTGVTDPLTMATLAKWTRFSKRTVCAAIKTLQAAGMLDRISKPWERSVFQLYPKPYKERAARRLAERKSEKGRRREMRQEGVWRYSLNERYRLNFETGEIQTQSVKGRGRWRPLKDRERHLMHKAIKRDFERALRVHRAWAEVPDFTVEGGSDSAQSGSDNAQGGSHSAQGSDGKGDQPLLPLPF